MARLIAKSVAKGVAKGIVATLARTIAASAVVLLAAASAATAGASAAQARAAFALDPADEAGSLYDFVVARMKRSDRTASVPSRVDVACQEAERFAAFLHDANPGAFARMMTAIRAGHPFVAAVRAGYGADPSALWEQFAR